MITLKNFSKSYNSNIVLSDINLTLESNKIIGIVGKNGSGKSTLFKCLASIESYDGEITFDIKDNIKKIGYLPTQPYILSKTTGLEYLQLLCNARNISFKYENAVNIFELPLNDYAENYSTGMLKKLAITALLLQKNEIYLLDEPYNGLDLESNFMLDAIIKQLKANNKTVIISSHMLKGLYEICDQINFIENKSMQQLNDKSTFHTLENHINSTDFNNKIKSLIIR
jgi:ABC-2 type transport system ATP-binding protein